MSALTLMTTTERLALVGEGERATILSLASPLTIRGWSILPGLASAAVVQRLHAAGLGTVIVTAPRGGRRDKAFLVALEWLRVQPEWQGLPVSFVGAGATAAAALRAASASRPSAVVTVGGRPERAYLRLKDVEAPSLLLLDETAGRLRRWTHAAVARRVGGEAEVLLVPDPSDRVDLLADWTLRDPGRSLHAAARPRRATRAVAAAAALVVAVSTPAAMLAAPIAASAAISHPADPFAETVTLRPGGIQGDGLPANRPQKPLVRDVGPTVQAPTSPWDDVVLIPAANVRGDGFGQRTSALASQPADKKPPRQHGQQGVLATGSQALVDSAGMKWLVNTDITFSTSSSASGAMSDASAVGPVSATTLFGGTNATTLHDAYDGYESLCVSFTGSIGSCLTGSSDYVIYNKNGPATTECTGRQVVLPQQVMGPLTVQRKVFVPSNDTFARWLNSFTNTSGSPVTFNATIANNLGSDLNTKVVSSTNGNATAEQTDTWITTFENYTPQFSSDPRLGHIFQQAGAPQQIGYIFFSDGYGYPWWGYRVTVNPGQTVSLLTYGVATYSKANAATLSGILAAGTNPNQYDCLTATEKSQVKNFNAGTDLSISKAAPSGLVPLGYPLTYTIVVNNLGPTDASSVVMNDPLPPGLLFQAITAPAGWACTTPAVGSSGLVSCTAPTLANGASATFYLTVRTYTAPIMLNSASVSSATPEIVPGNNSSGSVGVTTFDGRRRR